MLWLSPQIQNGFCLAHFWSWGIKKSECQIWGTKWMMQHWYLFFPKTNSQKWLVHWSIVLVKNPSRKKLHKTIHDGFHRSWSSSPWIMAHHAFLIIPCNHPWIIRNLLSKDYIVWVKETINCMLLVLICSFRLFWFFENDFGNSTYYCIVISPNNNVHAQTDQLNSSKILLTIAKNSSSMIFLLPFYFGCLLITCMSNPVI